MKLLTGPTMSDTWEWCSWCCS